jgi:hypothetical protein
VEAASRCLTLEGKAATELASWRAARVGGVNRYILMLTPTKKLNQIGFALILWDVSGIYELHIHCVIQDFLFRYFHSGQT